MDRLIQLQQRGRPSTVSSVTEVEEEDEDVADFYQYVPRRKGDFPPVSYEPGDDAPRSTRYEIVDREFENDIPVYIVRPRILTAEHELRQKAQSPRSDRRSVDVQDATKTRLSRSRTTASARSTPAEASSLYDPSDANLQRVDLFDIYSYVTQRDLERFETHRFRNPKTEDFPVIVSSSEASSVVAREERAHQRDEIKSEPPRKLGRPFKKRKKIDDGLMVVIESPRVTSVSGGGRIRTLDSAIEVEDSEDTQESPSSGVISREDIAPTIEDTADELDVMDMTTSLRGLGGPVGQKLMAGFSQPRRSTRSMSRRPSSSAERQTMREAVALPSIEMKKRRGRPAKPRLHTAHLQVSQPTLPRGSSSSHANGNMISSVSTSRSTSHASKQTTMDIYLKAKFTVEAANIHPSKAAHGRQTPRRRGSQPTLKANNKMPDKVNSKQPASKDQPVRPILAHHDEEVNFEEEDDMDEEAEYEISHIVLHDDTHGHGNRFYLVAWRGFPLEEATWLTERELGDAPDVLKAYLRSLSADGMG